MHKLASSVVISREIAEHGNGEQIVGQLLKEDIAASLDTALFSATAASTARPAGLLNGISGLTPTASGGEAAVRGDIAKLAAVAGTTGSANIAFITSRAYALRLATYANILGPGVQVWPSIAVADTTIIAVAIDAFVSGFGAIPKLTVAPHAAFQMEDTSPAQLSTAGTPNVVAAPIRSAFQTDSIAIRCVLDAAWILRSSAAVAWMTAATW
jgi:hypothetical protein